jgi:hypothetical protein
MGIYSSPVILGVRVLIENNGTYFTAYEFTGDSWRSDAKVILRNIIGYNYKIQTLHEFSTSYNLHTGQELSPGKIWLDNLHFRIEDL